MKCANCGHEFPVGKFCPSCGAPVLEASAQGSLAASFEEQSFADSYTKTEKTYSPRTEVPEHTYHPPVTPVMPAKRKRSGVIIAIILALVLVAGVVAGVLLLGKGPADKIGDSLKKSLDSEIFNFDVTVDAEGETMRFVGTVEFKPKESVLNLYMDATYTGSDEDVVICIYDNQYFGYSSENGEKWYTYSEIDEDAMDDFFDYYLEYSDSNLNKKKDVLLILEEIDDLSDGELSEIVDLDILAQCITEYVGEHNDKKWLKENAGFSQEKKNGITYYTYEPDLYDFCEVSLPYFEEAFEDGDVYDDAVDAVEDSRRDLKRISLEISFGIKSGYLTSVLMDVDGVEIEMTFSDFGKAELDYDELEDLASECEEGYEKQWSDYYD